MLVDRHHHALGIQAQLARGALHDADVGLMRNQPVDLGSRHAGNPQSLIGNFLQHRHRQLEDCLAIHIQESTALNRTSTHLAGHAQYVFMTAVGMQLGGKDARFGGSGHDHRASAIAKQDTGGAIFKIQDLRKNLGADHQYVLVGAGLDKAVRDRYRVHKPAAHRLHIKGCAAIGDAKLLLHYAGSTRETAEMVRG